MNNTELTTARKLLGLSVKEAAEHIGSMKQRSWEYLEQGEKPVPLDVAQKINFLLNRRREILKTVQQQMLRDDSDLKGMAVVFYPTPEFCDSILDWRFSQSLATTLAHDYGARLVVFDAFQYADWLEENNKDDTQQARSQWAAEWSANHD